MKIHERHCKTGGDKFALKVSISCGGGEYKNSN